MSRPPQKELNLPLFLATPFIQTALVLAFNAAGTPIGRDILMRAHWNFADVSTPECQRVSAASMAISTGFIALCLTAGTLMFSPNKPVARYNNALSNSAWVAGASPFSALLAPILFGYYLFGQSLADAAFVGVSASIGLSAIGICLALIFGAGTFLSSRCTPPYDPADEKAETPSTDVLQKPAVVDVTRPQQTTTSSNPMDVNTRAINMPSGEKHGDDKIAVRHIHEEPVFYIRRSQGHARRPSGDFRYNSSQAAFYSARTQQMRGHQRRISTGSDCSDSNPNVPGHRRLHSA